MAETAILPILSQMAIQLEHVTVARWTLSVQPIYAQGWTLRQIGAELGCSLEHGQSTAPDGRPSQAIRRSGGGDSHSLAGLKSWSHLSRVSTMGL